MMKPIHCLTVLLASAAFSFADPSPRDYLIGQVSRDVGKSIERAKAEGKPVWIIAWDKKKSDGASPEHHFGYFYQNPEVKKMVSENFVQVWTTIDDKEIEAWIDKNDKDHIPIFIVIDKEGKFLLRKQHYANPKVALQDVEAVLKKL